MDEISEAGSVTARRSGAPIKAPKHLNNTGCYINYVEGKGRGVFASQLIPAQTDIEISPVLLFMAEEYEQHGRHTVLDHYTFKWRDGRMALALGLGSLFNHSQSPNVSYTLEPETESIRYTTTRAIMPDEELCIFYGHTLWFQPADMADGPLQADASDDDWGGLSHIQDEVEEPQAEPYLDGSPDGLLADDELPFTRMKLMDDEMEDEMDAVQTEPAWVVDIPDPKLTGPMLRWLKHSGYDTPSLAHLKRIRKDGATTTLLVCNVSSTLVVPQLPPGFVLPEPRIVQVPRSAALTAIALQHKTTFWPTVYAPRKKHESEPWSRGRARWAWEAMSTVIREARAAKASGELPIVAYVPVPYDEIARQQTQVTDAILAYDTRISVSHPLRHAVLNLVRKVADKRAEPCVLSDAKLKVPVASSNDGEETDATANGSNYLLTSLTVFLSHEPCIMCSMALLHSRVKEIFYFYPMAKTGGCGGVACLPKLPGVNHRFGIGRWKLDHGLSRTRELGIDESTDA